MKSVSGSFIWIESNNTQHQHQHQLIRSICVYIYLWVSFAWRKASHQLHKALMNAMQNRLVNAIRNDSYMEMKILPVERTPLKGKNWSSNGIAESLRRRKKKPMTMKKENVRSSRESVIWVEIGKLQKAPIIYGWCTGERKKNPKRIWWINIWSINSIVATLLIGIIQCLWSISIFSEMIWMERKQLML